MGGRGKAKQRTTETIRFDESAALDVPDRGHTLQNPTSICRRFELVRLIVNAARLGGDRDLVRFAQDVAGAMFTTGLLKSGNPEFGVAFRTLDGQVQAAICFAVNTIRRFHEEQSPEPPWSLETW